MKIFQPQSDDSDDGFTTSFTFDDKDEQKSFSEFLNMMGISFLKSKFPVIEDGKVRHQIGFVILYKNEEVEPEHEPEHEPEPEPEQLHIEEKMIPKKKGKKVLDE